LSPIGKIIRDLPTEISEILEHLFKNQRRSVINKKQREQKALTTGDKKMYTPEYKTGTFILTIHGIYQVYNNGKTWSIIRTVTCSTSKSSEKNYQILRGHHVWSDQITGSVVIPREKMEQVFNFQSDFYHRSNEQNWLCHSEQYKEDLYQATIAFLQE